MSQPLSVVVVEPDPDRAGLIVDALTDGENYEIHVVAERASLARRIAQVKPDLVLVDVADPSRDIL